MAMSPFLRRRAGRSFVTRCLIDGNLDPHAVGTRNPLLELWGTYVLDHKNPRPYHAALRDLAAFRGCSPDEALLGLGAADALRYKAWSAAQPAVPIRRRRKNAAPAAPAGCPPGKLTSGPGRDLTPRRIDRRAANTTNQRLLIFKKFFRIALAGGVARINPFEGVSLVRGDLKRPTQAFDMGAASEMLRTAGSSFERALLAALIGGALRRSEASRLLVNDVTESQGVPVLRLCRTKNGKDKLQPLSGWAAAAVIEWRDELLRRGAENCSPLFPSHYGKWAARAPIAPKTVNLFVKRACARVGLDPRKFGAHSCRAAAVTALLQNRVDPRDVQEFGRFATLEMLFRYDKRARPLWNHAGLKLDLKRG